MSDQLTRIRRAYDLTAEQYAKGIDAYAAVPKHIQNMPGYREIIHNPLIGSGASDIKEYLKPERGMRFLDAGVARIWRITALTDGCALTTALMSVRH